MAIFQMVFYYLARFFIVIGDIVLACLSFCINSFLLFVQFFLKEILQVSSVTSQKFFTHKKSRRKIQTFSLSTKLKYFAIGTLFSFVFLFLPLISLAFLGSLPSPDKLSSDAFPQTTKIYDRHMHLLYQIYANQNRTVVPLSDIPKYLQEATIAIEDKNFYKNPGFDIVAIIRAFISDVTSRSFQGGSTITQQLIKSALLTSDQTISRKVEEIILAFWTQHLYSKNKILEMYFNQIPYGGTAWGVEAASQTYFGKSVKDLDLAQSAFLAGLPQSPTLYSPFGTHTTLWKNRQKEVLSHMQELGYITAHQEQQALGEELVFQPQEIPLNAPHFVFYIKDLLEKKYGLPLVEKGGLSVVTSLDLPLQQQAQQIVTNEVSKDGYLNLTNGAAVVTNPKNGDILAMVGSSDYNNPDWGNVNIATSLRQPGSSIKVVTYAAALASGYTPATSIVDSPITFPGDPPYSPVNYDGQFHGTVTLRQALANSFNIPAVKVLNSIGIDTFVNLGRAMGIESLQDASNYGLSVTLGSADVTMLDMATAYGTLANLGQRVDLNPILKITDSKGDILEEKNQIPTKKILDPAVAFLLGDILADNNARVWEFGYNSPLQIEGHRVSVKTGTTDDKRDNWTDGYTSNYVTSVWVGNNDNTPMSQNLASGITGAAPIWHDIMTYLLKGTKDAPLQIPIDVVSKQCLGHSEYFMQGTENSINCSTSFPTWTPTPNP